MKMNFLRSWFWRSIETLAHERLAPVEVVLSFRYLCPTHNSLCGYEIHHQMSRSPYFAPPNNRGEGLKYH